MTKLKPIQLQAAQALLMERPTVVPGTRAILNDELCTEWYDLVSQKIEELKLRPDQIPEFCDVAGVAD